jgi:repressor LexA
MLINKEQINAGGHMKFSEKLKALRKRKGLTQDELSKELNMSRSAVGMYETGEREPDFETLEVIADYFNVDMNELMGWVNNEASFFGGNSNAVRINVYGSIPAGMPIEAVDDVIDWEEISKEMTIGGKEYIGFKVKGDSMAPKYLDADIVIVQLLPDCESGQDCVVYVNGFEATLKKVVKQQYGIMLQPLNSEYDAKFYDYGDVDNPVIILGVVVEIRRKV